MKDRYWGYGISGPSILSPFTLWPIVVVVQLTWRVMTHGWAIQKVSNITITPPQLLLYFPREVVVHIPVVNTCQDCVPFKPRTTRQTLSRCAPAPSLHVPLPCGVCVIDRILHLIERCHFMLSSVSHSFSLYLFIPFLQVNLHSNGYIHSRNGCRVESSRPFNNAR